MKKKELKKAYYIIAIVVVALLWCFVNQAIRRNGDDVNFVTQSHEYTLWQWIYVRFMTRSGRIAAEAFIWIFAHIPLIFWKLATMFFSVFLGIYLYKYAIMFGNKSSLVLVLLCAFAPFLMNVGAFVDATLWITGAMNYMWIAVPGIIGMYYVVKELFVENYSMNNSKKGVVLFLIMISVSSSEQLGAVIIVLLAIMNISLFIKEKIDPYKIVLFISCVVLYIIVVFMAPGVTLRKEQSIVKRLPDFLTVSLELRIEYSIRWVMDALVNHLGVLLTVVWFEIAILLLRKRNKQVYDFIVLFTIIFAQVITLFKSKLEFLFDFEATWGLQDFNELSYWTIGIWVVILITTVIGLYLSIVSLNKKIISVLLLLAVYASTVIMVFSPTMYASGCRVMYHASLLLILLIFLMLSEIKHKDVSIAMGIILGCAILQYVNLYSIQASGYKIHLPW